MILITRPKEQSKNLELLLGSKGYETFLESLYNIKYCKNKVSYNKDIHYIFPSINSVQSLINSKQIYKFRKANILAIGKKVQQALEGAGCNKILLVTVDSDSMLKKLNSPKFINCNFTYLCSNVVNQVFLKTIEKYKIRIQKEIIYKTVPSQRMTKKLIQHLKLKNIHGVTFFSKLSVEIFLNLISKYSSLNLITDIHFYCISERVASVLRLKKLNFVHIALRPNQSSLVRKIQQIHH